MFVLSVERSGSTLLRYVLDTHSKIGAPGELGLGPVVSNLLRLVERTRPSTARHLAIERVRRILDEVMAEYLAAVKKDVWCDKAPMNVPHLGPLEEVFPDALYICLYRNCLDTVSSYLAAGVAGISREDRSYLAATSGNLVLALTKRWCDKTSRIMRFEHRHAARCHRVTYETFVRQPEASLAGMLQFLGLGWEPEILQTALAVPHYQGGGDYKIRGESQIHTRSVGRASHEYATYLSKPVIAQVNGILTDLGYVANL